jgi:hypothetical protein
MEDFQKRLEELKRVVEEEKEINPEDFKIEITSPEQHLAVGELYRLLNN